MIAARIARNEKMLPPNEKFTKPSTKQISSNFRISITVHSFTISRPSSQISANNRSRRDFNSIPRCMSLYIPNTRSVTENRHGIRPRETDPAQLVHGLLFSVTSKLPRWIDFETVGGQHDGDLQLVMRSSRVAVFARGVWWCFQWDKPHWAALYYCRSVYGGLYTRTFTVIGVLSKKALARSLSFRLASRSPGLVSIFPGFLCRSFLRLVLLSHAAGSTNPDGPGAM